VAFACWAAARLRYDLRAYALLDRFVAPQSPSLIARWEMRDVTIVDLRISEGEATVRARLYMPDGTAHPPGIVLVHGIHRLGIDEPRFVAFARAMAGSGYAVLTPELSALTDYRVDAASIATIGQSAAWFDERLGHGPVTVLGLSFSGSLALLAACDPQYAPHIRVLALMGAFDDLPRVMRFLSTGEEGFPDGRWVPFPPHDYGAAVFIYAHLAQFFPPADLPAAREALRDWLWEEPEQGRPLLAHMSPQSRALLEDLFARRVALLRPQLLAAIEADEPELAALSLHGRLGNLRVPVFILHGSEDSVIPPAESLWLVQDVPPRELRGVLITPVFSHVDTRKSAGLLDQLRLVHFFAAVLRAAD
jgi:pimeloyl-ACP methyl ester carboxylesterase